jgi:hypothetical protein
MALRAKWQFMNRSVTHKIVTPFAISHFINIFLFDVVVVVCFLFFSFLLGFFGGGFGGGIFNK